MNLAELRTEVFALLGDDADAPEQFTTTEIDRNINDTMRRMAFESGCLEIRHVVNLLAGVGVYDLPANVDRPYRVSYANEIIQATSVHELDRYQAGWQEAQGLIQVYYRDRIRHNQIGVWRLPVEGGGAIFDEELGALIDMDGVIHLRLESEDVSLGTVVDFSQGTDTVVFAAAGNGGGSDSDYGIVVDVTTDETSATYTFATEYGAITDWEDADEAEYDGEIFQATRANVSGINTADSEYGVTTGMFDASGTNTYVFRDNNGQIVSQHSFNQETGLLVDMTFGQILGETGVAIRFQSFDTYNVSQEFGLVIAMGEQELGVVTDYDEEGVGLEVWAKEDTTDLSAADDEPELPLHSHMGIAFGAAAIALMKIAETANPPLAKIYLAVESEYTAFLRGLVVRRAAEARRQMRQSDTRQRNHRRYPQLPGAYPRMTY